MVERTKVERDLASNQKWAETYTDGSLGVVMPLDMPIYVRAHALVEKLDGKEPPAYVTRVAAHVLEIDAWLVGVKVYVRFEEEDGIRRLKVMAEDADGVSVLETWESANL